jgi:hypothetical protein
VSHPLRLRHADVATVAREIAQEEPLDRDSEISRALEEALPLLVQPGNKEGLLKTLGMRLRALFEPISKEEIAWRLASWEKVPAQESQAHMSLRALVIFALRTAYRGETAARQELLDPAVLKRVAGNKTLVWTLQFHMMRLACAGITQAEQLRMRRLCLEMPVPVGLPAEDLKMTLRLREFMLRALQAKQAPESGAQRLLAISGLTDLAATVHEPLRSQLLARGMELRSLLPLQTIASAHKPPRTQTEGKASKS